MIIEEGDDGSQLLENPKTGARRREWPVNDRIANLERRVEELETKESMLGDSMDECHRAASDECERANEAEGDARMLAAFLVSDRAKGEQHWKSPFVSAGSEIHRIICKYESE